MTALSPEIVIRPLDASDDLTYRDVLEHLTDQDRYYRFFHAVRAIEEPELRIGAPGCQVIGLVAEDRNEHVGAAHAVLDPSGVAEIEVVVVPGDRHHGIGSHLVARLIEELRARRAREVLAYSISENVAFAGVARACGMHVAGADGGIVEWRLSL